MDGHGRVVALLQPEVLAHLPKERAQDIMWSHRQTAISMRLACAAQGCDAHAWPSQQSWKDDTRQAVFAPFTAWHGMHVTLSPPMAVRPQEAVHTCGLVAGSTQSTLYLSPRSVAAFVSTSRNFFAFLP